MKAICQYLRPRKREQYRATVVRLERENMELAREIARLRRKLILINDYIKRALA